MSQEQTRAEEELPQGVLLPSLCRHVFSRGWKEFVVVPARTLPCFTCTMSSSGDPFLTLDGHKLSPACRNLMHTERAGKPFTVSRHTSSSSSEPDALAVIQLLANQIHTSHMLGEYFNMNSATFRTAVA